MEIRLGTVIQNNSGYMTNLADRISEEELITLKSHIDEIHNFENIKRLLEILKLNSNEFVFKSKKSLLHMINNSLSIGGDKTEYYKQHLDFNRMFLNYLSSFRTFIDHNETTIKRKYGKDSLEAREFKKLTNNTYDKYFAYRFLYKLRNYSQHCGLPIEDFEVSATKLADNSYKGEGKIEFSAQELLANYNEWGAVKSDLEKYSYMSVYPIMEEMNTALDELWTSLVSLYSRNINESVKHINDKASHLRDKDKLVCIFTDLVDDEYGRLRYFKTLQIPFDVIDMIKIKNCN
jgi:hypothetical protein